MKPLRFFAVFFFAISCGLPGGGQAPSARKLMTDAAAMQAASAADLPSDQTIGYSIEDAFRKQLGLKLTKRRGLYPALILDHIEQTPAEN